MLVQSLRREIIRIIIVIHILEDFNSNRFGPMSFDRAASKYPTTYIPQLAAWLDISAPSSLAFCGVIKNEIERQTAASCNISLRSKI